MLSSISGYTLLICNTVSFRIIVTIAILNPRWSLIILRSVTYWPTWNIDFNVHLRSETARSATAFIIHAAPFATSKIASLLKSRTIISQIPYTTNADSIQSVSNQMQIFLPL